MPSDYFNKQTRSTDLVNLVVAASRAEKQRECRPSKNYPLFVRIQLRKINQIDQLFLSLHLVEL